MGYESKIYIVDRHNSIISNQYGNYCQIIAMVDMCKMHPEFYKLFDKPLNGFFFADDGNTEVVKDMYDADLYYADIDDVISYLTNLIEIDKDQYRRLPILLGTLKGIDKDLFEDIAVVNFGY